jgi:ubiquinone/menaquinone biosynthesis C-methylase UbiE
MSDNGHHVCPAGLAWGLDNALRRWIQKPRRILEPYVREGMTVLDFGCGPGFFSVELASLVGPSGRVIAADLQKDMLERLRGKVQNTELAQRIVLHQCEADRIGLSLQVDFVLAFYSLHEAQDQEAFFTEVRQLLTEQGRLLVVEPPIHVSKGAFEATLRLARKAGFTIADRPRVPLGRAAILRRD